MSRKILKSFLLFLSLTILIQIFYLAQQKTNFFSSTLYFPYGYAIHIIYYLAFMTVTFLFVGKFDFTLVGLKRIDSWKKLLLMGIFLAILGAVLKLAFVKGTFGQSFYSAPYYVIVPAFLFLGTLIALAEESAFRGYVFKNFSEKLPLMIAILVASFLFGIYHINYPDLNFSTLPFWTLYAGQALTGGVIMILLFYRTGNNLIAPIGYHATNIIIGQVILWTPLVNSNLVLVIEIPINLALVAILKFIPISVFGNKTQIQKNTVTDVVS
jgi:membrane protease YdiL (CAAX protease family)